MRWVRWRGRQRRELLENYIMVIHNDYCQYAVHGANGSCPRVSTNNNITTVALTSSEYHYVVYSGDGANT